MSQADNLAALATNVNSSGVLQPASGGTGATTAAGAANAILPSQTGNSGRYLTTDGTNTSWGTVTSNPGTVTSITAGTGLSGGTITSSGTIAIDSTVATLTGTQTLTNKTISGASNTLSNIGNASLTNSAITINGTSTSLGGSISVGTVTSVGGTGTVNGISLSGTVTGSGNLTLGGTLSGVNLATQVTGTLPVANGGTGLSSTPTNGQLNIGNGSGFTRATLTQGSGITITNGAGSITIAATSSGTVTSVATGNGLQGGTITTSGTLSVACPAFNTVGSYCFAVSNKNQNFNGAYTMVAGSNYSAGGNSSQIQSNAGIQNTEQSFFPFMGEQNLSGTWKWMASTTGAANGDRLMGIACRVS